jgi:two-component system, chemotaxis family, CheB/CheR fusion protein
MTIESDRPATLDFPVVGIGTSAGGLAVLKRFLDAMPPDSGMAFVIVQHLDPHHKSLTASLLAEHTGMPVIEATDRMPVEPDHVYVIPPNAELTLGDGVLHTQAPTMPRGMRTPIDAFFRSLAEQQQAAIGILLTGTGTDGTQGLKAIKGNAGMAMAQDPESAEFDGMVRSAIGAGLVDYVVPVEQMPAVLLEYVRHAKPLIHKQLEESSAEDGLDEILRRLRGQVQHDFCAYKQGSLLRRIGRRMALQRIDSFDGYVDFLQKNPDEVEALFQDLLISVTSFFRDPEAFRALEQVIARLVREKSPKDPLRIWVPGCASGEEAYSIAMLCLEQLQAADKDCPLQIFASDINRAALEVARTGRYPESIAADITPERLQEFFIRENSVFCATKRLRRYITFANQNLVADPPYSRLDLISCRNLLIYLRPESQHKVLALFHFALAEQGYLFLGSSETVGSNAELFEPVDRTGRIYRRRPTPHRRLIDLPMGMPRRLLEVERPAQPRLGRHAEILSRRLLADYTPAAVLVDADRRVRYSHGPVEHFLKRPAGAPTNDLLVQAREGLHLKLRTLLGQVSQSKRAVHSEICYVRDDRDALRRVRVSVEPVRAEGSEEFLLLVVFEEAPEPMAPEPAETNRADDGDEGLLYELQRELKTAREEQQHAIEDLEASNEELKSANEEILSMNEELQSSNEELETAREELQSMNEELSTLNAQLEGKLNELETANDNLQNLFANTDIAILFLDQQQRIRMFTPATRALFNLIPGDIGRPLGDISHRIEGRDLRRDAVEVLRSLVPMECEICTTDGHWYVQRLRPYRTHDDRIEGVAATFVDITDRKRAEYSDQRLATVVRDSSDAILTLDLAGRILSWNRGAEQIYGWSEPEMLGKSIEVLMPEGSSREARTFLDRLSQGVDDEPFEARRCARDGRELIMWATATAVINEQGKTIAVTCTERDVTALREVERELKFAMLAAEQSNAQKTLVLASASHDLRQPLQSLTLLNSVLARQVTDPQARKVIASQADNLAAMQSLLDSLLDIAQLDLSRVEPETSAFSSNEICTRMLRLFHAQAEQKGLQLRARCSSVMVRSDRELLQRIVHNLVSNAIRHTDKGGVLIACRRRGESLCIQVWDTGPGIPEDQLEEIFVMFHQVGNPARARDKGLGLGLAIAQRMARILGHPLTVRSRVGHGSMFAVEVPIDRGDDRGLLPARRPDRKRASETAAGTQDVPMAIPAASQPLNDAAANDLSVLLIEDDLGVAGALTMLGRISGQVWHWALEGEDALRQVGKESLEPDVLISDFRLPGGRSGLEVIAAIRARLQRQVPAILLTGDVTSIQREEVEKLGCRLLYKPVDDTRLLALINEVSGRSGSS